MSIRLMKTETNEILKYIREDNETIGLICDLIYIYARNITEVAIIKKEDINIEENWILFHLNQNSNDKKYPIHKDVKLRLMKYLETDKDYIFEEYIPINDATKVVNGYLTKHSQIFKGLIFKNDAPLSLSTIDFKVLRGQHLFLDGVSLDSIHELYGYKHLVSTKNIINYESLLKRKDININELFDDFTDLLIYKYEDYMLYNQYYCHMGNKECIVLIDKVTGECIFNGDNKIKNNINDFDFNSIKDYGDYKSYHNVGIMKI